MNKLDTFTRAYIECALWSSIGDNGEPLDQNYDIDDIANEAIAIMVADCKDFQEANAELLNTTCYTNWSQSDDADKPEDWTRSNDYDVSSAGHDFWLTRNCHGAGFWDRGLGKIGKQLTDMAHPYDECSLYVGDDGKIYVT